MKARIRKLYRLGDERAIAEDSARRPFSARHRGRSGQRLGHLAEHDEIAGKLSPPKIRPITGISTSSVSEVTILPNAAPMITATDKVRARCPVR